MSNSIASSSNLSRIAALFTLACALTGAPVAFANADEVIVKHVTVSFDDLNLQTESGAQQLLKRLRSAAIEACGGAPTGGPLDLVATAKRQFRACRGTAVRTAVTTVDHPVVTAVYLGHTANGRMARR